MRGYKSKTIEYQTKGSAAADLVSAETVEIKPGERAIVGTKTMGKELDLEDTQCAMVLSRSGLAANQGVFVLNAPGLIDPDYEGQIKVVLYNSGDKTVLIEPGNRIAQLLVQRFSRVWGAKISSETRGGAGIGSTGI